MAGDNDTRGAVSLQSAHRSKSCFEPSVVSLQRVVRMDLRLVEGRRQQLIEHPGVVPVPVGGDLHGRDPGPPDRSLEEPAGCLGVPAR